MREMKDSGIEWIGAIPNHWRVSKIKQIVRWKSVKGQPDLPVLSLYRDYGVIPKDSRDDNHNVTSLDTSGYKVVEHGDLVINKMKAWQGSLAVSEYNGIVSPAYHICKITSENICKKYLHYLLRDASYLPEYMRLSTGLRVGQWDLSFDDFKNIPFLAPPLAEQERIAAFLDAGCSEIDAVLEKTRASIEEYKKLKQAVITQAVTKGIRGDRPMKDSGIEWIGEIANEFAVYKFKYLLKTPMQYGANEAGITFDKTLPRYIRITDITSDGRLKQDNRLCIEDTVAKPYILQDGDLLFARSGGTVGKSFLYKQSYGNAAFAGYLIRAVVNRTIAVPEYVYYYTNSSIYDTWKNSIFIQSTIQNIGADRYSNMPIIVPNNIEEQRSIVEYLNERCVGIDALIRKKQQYLTEIENYKKSLIYEYVTGKKEVLPL